MSETDRKLRSHDKLQDETGQDMAGNRTLSHEEIEQGKSKPLPDSDTEDVFLDAMPSPLQFARLPLPKVPPFDRNNTKQWFDDLDSQFKIVRARTEADKFSGLLAYIQDVDLCKDVNSWLRAEERKRPVRNPFSFAKEKLTERFRKSLKESLGDLMRLRRGEDEMPSDFLRTLTRQAGDEHADLVKEIWEDNLPDFITAALHGMKDVPVETLAVSADAIHRAVNRKQSTVQQVHRVSEVTDFSERLQKLEVFLTKKVFSPKPPTRTIPTGRPEPSARQNAEHVLPRSVPPPSNRPCWYHRRFGSDATKCTCGKNF